MAKANKFLPLMAAANEPITEMVINSMITAEGLTLRAGESADFAASLGTAATASPAWKSSLLSQRGARCHGGSGLVGGRGAIPGSFASKETAGRKTSSAVGKPEGKRQKAKKFMERVFIGATRAEATRMADEWWGRQKGLRQTLRTEVAVGAKGPDDQLDQWAITIRYEDENPA